MIESRDTSLEIDKARLSGAWRFLQGRVDGIRGIGDPMRLGIPDRQRVLERVWQTCGAGAYQPIRQVPYAVHEPTRFDSFFDVVLRRQAQSLGWRP